MSVRRRKPLSRAGSVPCPLTADEVLAVLMRQQVPLSTPEVVEFCKSFYTHPGITLDRVRVILTFLHRQSRVQSWPGSDIDSLTGQGLDLTGLPNRLRYWAVTRTRGGVTP